MKSISIEAKNRRSQQKTSFPIEKEISKRRQYSDREVGLTHPDLDSFLRLNDQGDIEIFAAPGVGIVISARSKSISFFADSIRFFTKEDGLRWNSYNFNYSASKFSEPTLVKINMKSVHSAINGVYHFLDTYSEIEQEEQELNNFVTINAESSFKEKSTYPEQKTSADNNYDGLTMEQIGLIEAYSTQYSDTHISFIIKYLKEGYEFQQAHQKALREVNE